MKPFTKQLIFLLVIVAIFATGALIIKGATPSGNLKIKPSKTAKVKMVNQQNATTSSNNPVGWWKMDEGTGLSAFDSSGNGNTGTLTNGPTWTTGKLGHGLSFDGVDDYVSAGTASILDVGLNDFTISFWANINSSQNGDATIIDKKPTGGWDRRLWIPERYGGAAIKLGLESNMHLLVSSLYNTWAHYVITADRDGNAIGYVNGVAGTPVSIADHSGINFYGGSFLIGQPNVNAIKGSLDDIRIYNRALSAGEVAQMYNSTKDGYLGNIKVSTGLVGYWKLDDNNALTSVIDYSGKRNNGTAYSSTATSTSVLSTSTAMIGRAMSFDGVDDYVSVGSGSSLDIGLNDFTISFWANMNSSQNNNISAVIDRKPTAGATRQFEIMMKHYTYTPPITLNLEGSVYHLATPLYNTWAYYVITGDRDGNAIGYVNGVAGIPVSIAAKSGVNFYGGTLYISSPDGSYFNGLIDEVKIWNYARSAEQIKNDYVLGTLHREE